MITRESKTYNAFATTMMTLSKRWITHHQKQLPYPHKGRRMVPKEVKTSEEFLQARILDQEYPANILTVRFSSSSYTFDFNSSVVR